MFRSIRGRLIASYVLLTLLTVSVTGVLALSLVERFVVGQETRYLTANAEAVARQAEIYQAGMQSSGSRQRMRAGLQQLAEVSAYLGNARVRIQDADRQLLADSGPRGAVVELAWVMQPEAAAVPALRTGAQPFIVTLHNIPGRGEFLERFLELDAGRYPPGTALMLARQQDGAWGTRISFGESLTIVGVQPEQVSPTPAVESEPPDAVATPEPAQEPRLVVLAPIGDPANPGGYVEMSGGPGYAGEALPTIRTAFVLAGLGAALLAILLGLIVSHGLTAPLSALTSGTTRMIGGDLSVRVPARANDEIGLLTRQFNLMAERLEASFGQMAAQRDALRRFIADASHELRTPITALQTFNELLQQTAGNDPAVRAEFLMESQAQIERMKWITQNLLDLSRLEAGLLPLDRQEHEVAALVKRAVTPFAVRAQGEQITLRIVLPETPLNLQCDAARIEMALANLLDNALKFTPQGGQIEVRVTAADGVVRFEVQDDGPGIDPADLPHLFERWYRGKGSRSAGNGLGLAIVQAMAQAHGGAAWAENAPATGSLFVFQVPLSVHAASGSGPS